ncbi:hypothetical protein AU467_25335 [Mesorhizobium loti]|uniref:Uncharacterized protein n=1 Tax=Rhizobium loti TaxID=381 RepID=A0A117N371_RHILI|nr:hypothetical protein AU467_25335 [Mesorhizobium loti]
MEDNSEVAAKEGLKDMSFKVGRGFHYRFKIEAIREGITMKDLLVRCFEAYIRSKSDKAS